MATQGSRRAPVMRIAFVMLLMAWMGTAQAAIPYQINYQGLLTRRLRLGPMVRRS